MSISRIVPVRRQVLWLAWLPALCLLALPAISGAFQEEEDLPQPGADPKVVKKLQGTGGAAGASPASGVSAGGPEQEVEIKREAVRLTDPKAYRVPLQLRAAQSLTLTAPTDGWVRSIAAKPQAKLNQQAEALRLDDARSALVLKRAKAHLQAAQLEKKLAQAKGDADLLALAEARVEAAQADVDLSQMEADQLVLRAPFAGTIERVYVVEKQFVRAGERLATLIDPSKLVVEIPVEREKATVGGVIDIRVEETAVKARVESVASLEPQFDALRELAISPASAVVAIDNADGRFAPGQTVYCELIPLAPVALAPSIAISNTADGQRKVQVLRDSVVRDLTVRIMGKVGTDSVFVSGRFQEGDEIIVSSSRSLADGTPLRALVAPPSGGAASGAGRPAAAGQPAAGGKKPAVGF